MSASDIQGEFEHQVLLATLRLGENAFTAAIVVELEERTQRSVSPAAVYVALRRLEKKKLVRSELRTGDQPGRLRERRFFVATEDGVTALRESRARLGRLWEGLESVLAEG
ncbi:MAG: PadR family transcriptional regulator [Gemmatimonadetes bacterium]|nr:PadR family transcriptional regulator [Gemmatimonadota bacterium]